MATKATIEFDASELGELITDLAHFAKVGTRRKIVRSGLNAFATPYKREIRRQIRSTKSIRHKHLVKSIVSKSKIYRSGGFMVVIGARNKRHPDGDNPGNYYHLVDLGVKPHSVSSGASTRGFLGLRRVFQGLRRTFNIGRGQHPGFAARDIRKRAVSKVGDKAFNNFSVKFKASFDREWLKTMNRAT